ncbi:hypothetical protein HZC34_05790 [Candidatus Saganbacteria bacterium]|nr:hypothetical protein [Candidatus Saganbacteria bacterium]
MKTKIVSLFVLILFVSSADSFAANKNATAVKKQKVIKTKIRQIGNEIQQINKAIIEIRNEKLNRIIEAQKLKEKLLKPKIIGKARRIYKPRIHRAYHKPAPQIEPKIIEEEAPPAAESEVSIIQNQIKKLTSNLKSLGLKFKRAKNPALRKSLMRQMNAINSKIKALKKKLKKLQGEEEVSLPQPEKITAHPPPPITVPPPQPVVKPVEPAPKAPGETFQIKSGIIAGSAALMADYVAPLDKGSELVMGAGFGSGVDYTVTMAEIGMMFKADVNYWGPTVTYHNFSNPVMYLVGMPSLVSDGGKIGIGVQIGRNANNFFAESGYNTSSGVYLDFGYKF